MEVPKHPLGTAGTASKADNANAALAASYTDSLCARRARWPSRFRGPETLPLWPRHVQWAREQQREGITMGDDPDKAVFVQDASWYPNHTAGGGLVVAYPVTVRSQTYRIPILVHMDGFYQAALYVAWEVLQARGGHRVVWGTRGTQWSFHDSKGYIDAVPSRNPGSSPLSDDLLRACMGVLGRGVFCFSSPVLPPRRHLSALTVGYRRRRGEETGREGPAWGGLNPGPPIAPGLFQPQYRSGAQRGPSGGNRGRHLWGLHMEAAEQRVRKSVLVYHAVTERGLIRWGAHLRTIARRAGLGHAGDTRLCPTCLTEVVTRHWVSTGPRRHLFRLAVHTQLHMCLDTFCARRKRRAVSSWGVIVLNGPDAFALSMGSPDDEGGGGARKNLARHAKFQPKRVEKKTLKVEKVPGWVGYFGDRCWG